MQQHLFFRTLRISLSLYRYISPAKKKRSKEATVPTFIFTSPTALRRAKAKQRREDTLFLLLHTAKARRTTQRTY